jgi:hypothetical protein
MIPTPTSEFIEETTKARRRQILGILPKKMLEGMCDQDHRPWTMPRNKLLAEALAHWEDNDRAIVEYLDRAFDGRLDITY